MICESHKLDPSKCPHGWNELLLASKERSKNKLNDPLFDYNKLLASIKVENIAKELLKKKKKKEKSKGDKKDGTSNIASKIQLCRDLGFSKLIIQIPKKHDSDDNTTADDTSDTFNQSIINEQDEFQYQKTEHVSYFHLGYQMDYNNIQIKPPVYTPSIDPFDQYFAKSLHTL